MTHGFSSHLGGQSPLVGLENSHSFLPASPDTVPKETAATTLPARLRGVQGSPCRCSFQQVPATQSFVVRQSKAGDKATAENGAGVEQRRDREGLSG